MLSFEFSAFDLVLSVGVIVLIILFVTTLLKLNPSEDKKSRKEMAHEEEQEFVSSPHPLDQLSNPQDVPYANPQDAEKATFEKVPQPPKLTVSATAGGYSQESLEQTSKPIEHKEPPKNQKTSSHKQTTKSSSEKDCLHFFGYLGSLPKNTPIPGECFGCEKIVDCLITVKGKS